MGEPPPLQQQCSTPPSNGPPPDDHRNQPQEEELQQEEDVSSSSPASFYSTSEPRLQEEETRMHASADAPAADDDPADRQQQHQHEINPPPYWSSTTTTTTTRHARSSSYHSLAHAGGPIQLEDHSEDQHEQSQGCWARSATVDDYTVVSGSSGIGAYVVWHCTVRTLKGGDMNIRKRYSDFDRLRQHLVASFPHAEASIPALPRKSVISRFRPKFLEQRKSGLDHFVSCVLLNPEFAASPVVREFVFEG